MVRALGSRPQPQREQQASPPAPRWRGRNLALQPAALGLGRKLGQRFLKAGREVTVLEGALTQGSDSRRVVVHRVQDDAGERVEVTVAGGGAPLTWDAIDGAVQAGRPADAEETALAKRIALDGPDQFVLAQLRGASYTVVGRSVRADEGGGEGYAGPLYDVVRVGEPARVEGSAPAWRLYYLDTKTGLLDRVATEEGGERVEAALMGWVEREGEWQPSHITWSRQGQVFMELAVTNAAHGPKQ
ncbi:MAG: hypothetical protein ACJ74T_09850 [Pyrinomonadaceae bacterium]